MSTYKIVDTTVSHFKNIVLELNFDNYNPGDPYEMFGEKLTIVQKGSGIVTLTNSINIFVLQIQHEGI